MTLDRGTLDRVADDYRAALATVSPSGRLTEFDLTNYDRTGVPVAATVFDEGGSDAHGVGYGADRASAVVGALGELAERVLARAGLRDAPVRRASYRELVAEVGTDGVADPVRLVLDATAAYDDDRPLHWVTATRWRTGEPVLVPAEFAAADGGSLPRGAERDGLITPITNGMGAGDTLERAVGHGLLELVQRDGDNVVFRALDQGVVLDLDGAGPQVTDAVARLRAAGVEPVAKLASTEFAVVTYCVGRDDDPDTVPVALSAVGEAAHPDREVSVAKALLEFASSRARRVFAFGPLSLVEQRSPDYLRAELARPLGPQEPRALEAMRRWTDHDRASMAAELAPLFRVARTVPFASLPTAAAGTPVDLLALLLDRLAAFDVLVVPAGVGGGVRAAKVLAPGLEVETMSYLRVGERAARQLLERGDGIVGRGAASGGRLPVRLRPDALERLGGPVWVDPAAVDRAMGTLYPLYREPRRHAVQRTA